MGDPFQVTVVRPFGWEWDYAKHGASVWRSGFGSLRREIQSLYWDKNRGPAVVGKAVFMVDNESAAKRWVNGARRFGFIADYQLLITVDNPDVIQDEYTDWTVEINWIKVNGPERDVTKFKTEEEARQFISSVDKDGDLPIRLTSQRTVVFARKAHNPWS